MYPKGFFITGTGTGVGKTLVTASLLMGLRSNGVDAIPMKPVQTGIVPGGDAADIDYILEANQLVVGVEVRQHMCPLQFAKASSPHLAARLENWHIDISELLEHKRWLELHHDVLLVEGAGGILVPLNETETMLELMLAIGYPVILVIDNALGAINHSLLSLQVLRTTNVKIAGVIFTESRIPDDPEIIDDNIETILNLGNVTCIGRIPHQGSGITDAILVKNAANCLNVAALQKF